MFFRFCGGGDFLKRSRRMALPTWWWRATPRSPPWSSRLAPRTPPVHLLPDPGTRKPRPENRKPKTENRNPEPETRNPKPETRNPKPDTLDCREPSPEPLNTINIYIYMCIYVYIYMKIKHKYKCKYIQPYPLTLNPPTRVRRSARGAGARNRIRRGALLRRLSRAVPPRHAGFEPFTIMY